MSNNFKIVTVCTHWPTENYYCLREWFASLHGHEPLILDRQYTAYSGLGSKVKGVYKAIKEGLVNTSHILFVDCWDFFFAADPQILFEKYFEFNSSLVISAEANCFPADLMEQYDTLNPSAKYRYLNSGMIIGETAAFLELLEYMKPDEIVDDYRMEDGNNFHTNDQFLYQQAFLQQPVKIALDYNQSLCQTLHDINIGEFEFTEAGIKNKITGTYPAAFHANGSAKSSGVKEPILKYLGL